jgi:hypothetical protein
MARFDRRATGWTLAAGHSYAVTVGASVTYTIDVVDCGT